MALPTTGALSLSAIQTEFGGANPISISEYYAGGGLVASGTTGTNGAVPSSGQISFSIFYGTSAAETQTVTVGSRAIFSFIQYGYNSIFDPDVGSISDGTFGFISNAPIKAIYWYSSDNAVVFSLSGNRANSGWTKMTISGVDYTRASATYTYDSGGDSTSWRWAAPGTNPFGTTVGATKAAVFT